MRGGGFGNREAAKKEALCSFVLHTGHMHCHLNICTLCGRGKLQFVCVPVCVCVDCAVYI